jgi:hypothetical protein
MGIDCAAAARAAGVRVLECRRHAMREGDACDTWITEPCPFCGQCHSHGASEGLRLAHCVRVGPAETYYLVEGRGNQ